MEYKLSSRFSYFSLLLDANTFVSSGSIFSKIENDFNILVLFSYRPVGTYKTSIFGCLIGKNDTLLIDLCAEASRLVKNVLPIESILPLISFP